LEAVHLSASNAMKQLQRLDDTVTSIDAEVQGNKTTLSTISDGLSQNMEEIRTAMKSVSK
jgi:predicted KAP-like P-loop ATPase